MEHNGHSSMGGDRRGGKTPAVLLGDLNMLRCFAGTDVPVEVAASDPEEVTLKSRHCAKSRIIAPFAEVDRVLDDLERIGRDYPDKPVLYYGNDAQLLVISRHRQRLGRWFRFQMPAPDLIEALVDKSQFAELAPRAGIPVPATANSREATSADQILERVPLPCVIKPNCHIGWYAMRRAGGPQKALRADTPEEFRRLYEEVLGHTNDFVVQQFIPGGEDLIYSFHAYIDAKGRSLGHYVGKKIRTYPMQAGVSTYLELIEDPRVVALGLDIVDRLGFSGPVKIDMKRDPRDDRFYVLELNPRYNLWHYLGARSGINLPLAAHADLSGQPVEPQTGYRTGVRWLSFGNDFRSFIRDYRPNGGVSIGDYLGSLRSEKVYDVFAWDDPVPWAASVLQYGKALGSRLLGSAGR